VAFLNSHSTEPVPKNWDHYKIKDIRLSELSDKKYSWYFDTYIFSKQGCEKYQSVIF